jgi:IS30 family transposase
MPLTYGAVAQIVLNSVDPDTVHAVAIIASLKDVLIICHHNVYRVVAVDDKTHSTAQNAIVGTCRAKKRKGSKRSGFRYMHTAAEIVLMVQCVAAVLTVRMPVHTLLF